MSVPNVRFYPSPIRVELNDKATKILFNMTPEVYQKMVAQGLRQPMIERRKFKKKPKVQSSFVIQNQNGYTAIIELDEFDRAVLAACISEYDAKNFYLTPAIIYRGLTGKVGKSEKPSPQLRTAILQSIELLRQTLFLSEVADAFKKLNYDTAEVGNLRKATPILPCERITATINGNTTADAIHILGKPPLLILADAKSQILRYPAPLLDVPHIGNSRLNIALKNYVMRRVVECIKHKNMAPTLTLDDVFRKCRIADKDRKANLRARECITAVLEHLKNQGVIGQTTGLDWKKKGNAYDKISFVPKKLNENERLANENGVKLAPSKTPRYPVKNATLPREL